MQCFVLMQLNQCKVTCSGHMKDQLKLDCIFALWLR